MSEQNQNFRAGVKDWIKDNFPSTLKGQNPATVGYAAALEDDHDLWRQRLAEKGWGAPTWPKEYGGAGLGQREERTINDELSNADAFNPIPGIALMGVTMVGPTILDYGTEEQKIRHLIPIARGEVKWCLGLSEPGAGSDLASLRTRAVDDGDHYVVNGSKIWTSGAQHADWMFALVRTDPDAPKHDGISFVLLDMHQPGVTVKPIALISGSSPFCETFLDNAIATRDNLIGELGKGWTVGKRLLQYERSAAPAVRSKVKKANAYATLAKAYVGEAEGKIADHESREQVLGQTMNEKAMQLTVQRVFAESQSGKAPGATTSIFKYFGSSLSKGASALKSSLRGTNGVGWEGEGFTSDEVDATRGWLRDRAVTIYGGTNEVQLNIISKRVLGLPD